MTAQERRNVFARIGVGGRDSIGSLVLTSRYLSTCTFVLRTSSISITRLISHGTARRVTPREPTRPASYVKSPRRAALTKCPRRENEKRKRVSSAKNIHYKEECASI